MNDYLKRKIDLERFLCICIVILGHGSFVTGDMFVQDYPITGFIQRFVSGGLSQPSVRLFYCISGFLFFQHFYDWNSYFKKLRRRVNSLVIPYFLWNLIFVSYFMVIYLMPYVNQFVNHNVVDDLRDTDYFYRIYLLFITPINGPLWFVRDLMVFTIILSPLLFWIRNKKCLVLGAVFLLFFLGVFLKTFECAFFYSFGIVISLYYNLDKIKINTLVFSLSFLLFVLYSFNQVFHFMMFPSVIGNLFGLVVYWKLYDYVFKILGVYNYISNFAKYSFFIYCAHEPLYEILKKISVMILGQSEWTYTVLYFTNPFIFIVIIVCVSVFLERRFNKIYSILAGSR